MPAGRDGLDGDPARQHDARPPGGRTSETSTADVAVIVTELRTLCKGRGVQYGQFARRVGPTLRLVFGIAEHDNPIERAADWLRDTIAGLPPDLQISAQGAFGLHDQARHCYLRDRVAWVAEQLDRDSRTARRRINIAINALAELAVQPKPSDVDLHGLVGKCVELTWSPCCTTDNGQITRQCHLLALAQVLDHPNRCLAIVNLSDQSPSTIAIPTTRILSAAPLDEIPTQPTDDRPHSAPRATEEVMTELAPHPEGTGPG